MKATIVTISVLTFAVLSIIGISTYRQNLSDSYTVWKTSKNWILFSLPDDWQVKQSDFGGGSVLTISDKQSEIGSILAASSVAMDGTPVDFASWVQQMKERFELTNQCEETVIDALPAECWQDADSKRYFVQTPTQYFLVVGLEDIHETINFFPDLSKTTKARIIP